MNMIVKYDKKCGDCQQYNKSRPCCGECRLTDDKKFFKLKRK